MSIAICVLALSQIADAAPITITSNSDVIAGRSAFLGSGTTTKEFDWDTLPDGSVLSTSVTLPDLTVNAVTGLASLHPTPLNIKNWVNAAGFTGKDLAINGIESFDLIFGKDHRSVGLAIITGTGLFPNEVDLTGATFAFTALDAGDAIIGSATFALASGSVDQAWLTLTSTTPFRKIEVREVGAQSIADQYFSDILTSVEDVTAVPEPSTLALLGIGCVLSVGVQRRRKNNAA